MTASPKFWDRIAEKYARDPVADEASYQRKLDETRALFRPDMQVLEIGCGTGTTSLRHAAHVAHIRATDISPKMIAICERRKTEAGVENVTFEVTSTDDLQVVPGSMDMVMAHSLLHLVDDHRVDIDRIWTMLKPGGHFVSSTVCMTDAMWWFRPISAAGHAMGLLPLLRYFTGPELLQSVRDRGFEIETQWRPGPRKSIFIIARKPA